MRGRAEQLRIQDLRHERVGAAEGRERGRKAVGAAAHHPCRAGRAAGCEHAARAAGHGREKLHGGDGALQARGGGGAARQRGKQAGAGADVQHRGGAVQRHQRVDGGAEGGIAWRVVQHVQVGAGVAQLRLRRAGLAVGLRGAVWHRHRACHND